MRSRTSRSKDKYVVYQLSRASNVATLQMASLGLVATVGVCKSLRCISSVSVSRTSICKQSKEVLFTTTMLLCLHCQQISRTSSLHAAQTRQAHCEWIRRTSRDIRSRFLICLSVEFGPFGTLSIGLHVSNLSTVSALSLCTEDSVNSLARTLCSIERTVVSGLIFFPPGRKTSPVTPIFAFLRCRRRS